MRLNQSISVLVAGTTTVMALVAQPAQAAQTEVTNIQLRSGANGIELVLNTQGNNRPPIFTVSRGNSTIADINDTQLRLTGGKSFEQANPAPGITAVTIRQLDPDTVRVTVQGANQAPAAQVVRQDQGETLVLSYKLVASLSESPPAPTPLPPATGQPPNAVPPFRTRAVAPPVGDIAVAPIDVSPETIDLGTDQVIPRLLLREAPVGEVLTLLGRAAGINIVYLPPERIEAKEETPEQTRTVSQTVGNTTETVTSNEEAKAAESEKERVITISMDIENEPIQAVFNYVLRVAGLQANREGNTIFVGKTLPGTIQNQIIRSYRLNQLQATACNSIEQQLTTEAQTGGSLGAGSTAASPTTTGSAGGTVNSSLSANTTINRQTTTRSLRKNLGAKEILESYGANLGGTNELYSEDCTSLANEQNENGRRSNSDILKGLQVVPDTRTNAVTLIGNPRSIEIATSLLTQLDVRKRQAAVNVKIVDVNLLKGRSSNADLQFRANNTLGITFNQNGTGLRVGNNPPTTVSQPQVIPGQRNPTTGVLQAPIVFPALIVPGVGAAANLAQNILLNLLVSIQNNNAKILTNPTLIVQEGSSAQVNLTQEIFSGVIRSEDDTGSRTTITETPILRPAGVILNVNVDRIDDNGFVTLNISPEISAPSGSFTVIQGGQPTTGTLLAQRRLESGQIRLRDGQTLLLTGIIQDSDQVSVSKVPILGDIPLLGRLFRRENKTRERREVVVVITPKILSDSDQSSFGYEYTPSPETQKLLDR